jgi:hypothetical protein
MKNHGTWLFFLLVFQCMGYAQVSISFIAPNPYKADSCVQITLRDAAQLLNHQNGATCSINNYTAAYRLHLPDEFDTVHLKKDAYQWSRENGIWQLQASTSKGISNGIYGFLQEVCKYRFFHPRGMIIPTITYSTLTQYSHFEGTPVFEDMGFHLHTMHPIELTEDLLDEKREGGLPRIYEYIDWLARNGQNYFEFNVLESIQLESWIYHARKISNYAHQRGIRCGLDLSLHMLQQKAFQLYETPPFKFEAIKKQIDYNVAMLSQTNFDVWNVELSATEFTSGNQDRKKEVLMYLTNLLNLHHIELMSRNHVVQPNQMVNGGNGKQAGEILADGQGLMVHTVMFYSLTDEKAPVYRNKNLRHMYNILKKEMPHRKTWYFPESAYWVTFDSSVPMFLLPYFSARLSDIELCEKEGVPGHITFTSGWEWGYGYIDWSIARWCWNYRLDDLMQLKQPLQYLSEMSYQPAFTGYLQEEAALQQTYIKDQELIRVLVAQTVTDELPGSLNIEFHPRPVYSYPYIRNKASIQQLDSIQLLYLDPLKKYFTSGLKNDSAIFQLTLGKQEEEIFNGIYITHLRAKHKWYTLQYLVQHRRNHFAKNKQNISGWLVEAKKTRLMALEVVKQREANYRYDQQMLSTRHPDHTCYHFGYLYTVHQLHFWEREELQAKNNQYHFMFRNIWNVGRTVGLID